MSSLILFIITGFVLSVILISFLDTLLWFRQVDQFNFKNESASESKETVVLFLSGISDYRQRVVTSEQLRLLQDLAEPYQSVALIRSCFPFDDKKRVSLWSLFGLSELPLPLISLNNFWQGLFLRSNPQNYSNVVCHSLGAILKSYSAKRLVVVAGSIGASMLALSVKDLKTKNKSVSVYLLSVGGFFVDKVCLDDLDGFIHIYSENDIWSKFANRTVGTEELIKSSNSRGCQFTETQIQGSGHMAYLACQYEEVRNHLRAYLDDALLREKFEGEFVCQ